jgi:hypothetical protein
MDMAAIIERLGIESTLGPEGSRLDVPFLIKGATTRLEAHEAIQGVLFAFYIEAGMTLHFQNYDLIELGAGVWDARAHYSRKEPRGDNSGTGGSSNPFEMTPTTFSFDTSGGTAHRTMSIANVARTLGAPDCQGAIGVNDDTVEGVDVEAAGFAWTETRYWPRSLITSAYIDRLYRMSQHVNITTFVSEVLGLSFEPGECRFRHAQGGPKDSDQMEIAYHFHAEPNTVVTVNSLNLEKRGQDYFWQRYRRVSNAGEIILRPHHGYVEQVYEYADFADLNP